MARDSRKYIFILAVAAFWLLQFPHDPQSPFSLAHWLNALTNPFNLVLRSAHMTGAFLLPSVVFPLFVLGIDAVWELVARRGPPDRPRVHGGLVCAAVALIALAYVNFRVMPRIGAEPHLLVATIYVTAFALLVVFPLALAAVVAMPERFSVRVGLRRLPLRVGVRIGLLCALLTLLLVSFLAYKVPQLGAIPQFAYIPQVGGQWRYAAAIVYVSVFAGLSILALLAVDSRRLRPAQLRTFVVIVFSLMALSDLAGSRVYIDQLSRLFDIKTHEVAGIPEPINPIAIDYQNPFQLPVRQHYTSEAIGDVDYWLQADAINNQGAFYRYTDLYKYFREPTNYTPRHRSYAPLASDAALQEYVKRDTRIAFLADLAVRPEPGALQRILDTGLDRRVVVAETGDDPALPTLAQALPSLEGSAPRGAEAQWYSLTFRLGQAEMEQGTVPGAQVYSLALPAEFPSALTTTVFTPDRADLVATVDGVALAPAPGWLVRPYQFDLQNIRLGQLMLALPDDEAAPDSEVELRYRVAGLLHASTVWRNQPDAVGFTFSTPRAAWLVLHYPFDEKWRLRVNGQEQPIYRVNGAFLGVPVMAGENRVLLEYWPGTPVRWLIPVSWALSTTTLITVLLLGYRRLVGAPGAARLL